MVRLPAALALRTNGALIRPAAAAPPATTRRRDTLLNGMTFVLPEERLHTQKTLTDCFVGALRPSTLATEFPALCSARSLAGERQPRQTVQDGGLRCGADAYGSTIPPSRGRVYR